MTDAAPQPSLMTRLTSALRGEVSAATVEAFRRAGSAVYDDLAMAEQSRRSIVLSGTDLWSTTPGQGSQLLATWNAFALQTIGEQLVEADYRVDPKTVGFLPPVTQEQAARFLGEVEQWSALARRAGADATFAISEHTALPALLPAWVEVEPCPEPHVQAMIAAARSMREHLQAAQADFAHCRIPDERAEAAAKIAGLIADADAAISYGESMWKPGAPRAVHERAETSLKRGIEAVFMVGQLLAMPSLLDQPSVGVATATASSRPLPGQPGFDPWCLTDPYSRASWRRDPAARRAIDLLWRSDPDPASTLTIQAQIDAAAAAGLIVAGQDATGRKMGNYYCCPWSAIYLVRMPVVIAGRSLRPGQQFTFDVSAEEMMEGGAFKRNLLMGPFHPTSNIDYCDPRIGGH